jgi:hypothetical protein
VDLKCSFVLYVDSTSAITNNVSHLRNLIPKRTFAINDDILSTMRAAPEVQKHFTPHHVKSHQDDSFALDKLPFAARLNVLCYNMAFVLVTKAQL